MTFWDRFALLIWAAALVGGLLAARVGAQDIDCAIQPDTVDIIEESETFVVVEYYNSAGMCSGTTDPNRPITLTSADGSEFQFVIRFIYEGGPQDDWERIEVKRHSDEWIPDALERRAPDGGRTQIIFHKKAQQLF